MDRCGSEQESSVGFCERSDGIVGPINGEEFLECVTVQIKSNLFVS